MFSLSRRDIRDIEEAYEPNSNVKRPREGSDGTQDVSVRPMSEWHSLVPLGRRAAHPTLMNDALLGELSGLRRSSPCVARACRRYENWKCTRLKEDTVLLAYFDRRAVETGQPVPPFVRVPMGVIFLRATFEVPEIPLEGDVWTMIFVRMITNSRDVNSLRAVSKTCYDMIKRRAELIDRLKKENMRPISLLDMMQSAVNAASTNKQMEINC